MYNTANQRENIEINFNNKQFLAVINYSQLDFLTETFFFARVNSRNVPSTSLTSYTLESCSIITASKMQWPLVCKRLNTLKTLNGFVFLLCWLMRCARDSSPSCLSCCNKDVMLFKKDYFLHPLPDKVHTNFIPKFYNKLIFHFEAADRYLRAGM